MIVAQAGDTVVVHFKNLASQPYSVSPVGISYWKHSEGDALYPRSFSQHHPLSLLPDSSTHSYTPEDMSQTLL